MTKKNLRLELAERQDGKCAMCGEPLGDINLCDIARVVPKREGGSYEMANLMLAHAVCNQERTQGAPLRLGILGEK